MNLWHIGVQALLSSRDGFLVPYHRRGLYFVTAYCDSGHIERTTFIAKPSLRPANKPRALLEG